MTALDELKQVEAEVAAAQQRVSEQEAAVNTLRGELSQVAVRAYMGAGTNGFGAMFSNSSAVTAALQRDQLSRVALSAGTATTDELDQAISDLQDERDALERKQEEATAKAEQVEEAKQATDEQKAEYEEARTEAEAELGRRIQEEEERRARESYARMQREAEQAAARQASASQQAQARAQAAPRLGWRRRRRRWRRRRGRRRGAATCSGRPGDPRRVVSGGHGDQRRAEPGRRRLPLRHRRARRGVRLLRVDVVGVGASRRVAAAPVAGAAGQRAQRAD